MSACQAALPFQNADVPGAPGVLARAAGLAAQARRKRERPVRPVAHSGGFGHAEDSTTNASSTLPLDELWLLATICPRATMPARPAASTNNCTAPGATDAFASATPDPVAISPDCSCTAETALSRTGSGLVRCCLATGPDRLDVPLSACTDAEKLVARAPDASVTSTAKMVFIV